MLSDVLSVYVPLPPQNLERLMCLPAGMVYTDPDYGQMINGIDVYTLRRTIRQAQIVLDRQLPGFCAMLRRDYGVMVVLTGYMLTEWLLEFVTNPDRLGDLRTLNTMLPRHILWDTLPLIISMLDDLSDGREAWQAALTTLLLPLTATR